jgi:hypothetical protein
MVELQALAALLAFDRARERAPERARHTRRPSAVAVAVTPGGLFGGTDRKAP